MFEDWRRLPSLGYDDRVVIFENGNCNECLKICKTNRDVDKCFIRDSYKHVTVLREPELLTFDFISVIWHEPQLSLKHLQK